MKSLFHYLLPLLSLVFIASSCQKEDVKVQDKLPPITQEGLNTFGCKINGEVFGPKDGEANLFVQPASGLSIVFGTDFNSSEKMGGEMGIYAVNAAESKGGRVFLYLPHIDKEGDFDLDDSNGSSVNPLVDPHAFVINSRLDGHRSKYLSYKGSGGLNIQNFNFSSQILSGTFEFQAVNEADYTDTISITDGRFDINWRTLNQE